MTYHCSLKSSSTSVRYEVMFATEAASQTVSADVSTSWSCDSAQQLPLAVRQTLIGNNTIYKQHLVISYRHPTTAQLLSYAQITVVTIHTKRRQRSVWYGCYGPQHCCKQAHTSKQSGHFFTHLNNWHRPHTICMLCSKLVLPHKFTSHYNACSAPTDVKQPRLQQREDMEVESQELAAEQNEAIDTAASVDTEQLLVDELNNNDEYIPVQRIKRIGSVSYSVPLLRIETLQYFDKTVRVTGADPTDEIFAEWMPRRCRYDKDNCNVVHHGTFVRFCYDSHEVFLIEIKRYKCTRHVTGANRTSQTFSMLDECVSSQMSAHGNVRKSLDVVVFDSVLLTAALYGDIANITLVILNDSHFNTSLKHQYRRTWRRKLSMHRDYKPDDHECTARSCYGLTMQKADEWVTLYNTITQRALDIKTTRRIYQQHILPISVIPNALRLQQKIITQHCTEAISMDHTFKVAKFGVYVDIMKDTPSHAAQAISNDNTLTVQPIAAVDTVMTDMTPSPSPSPANNPNNQNKRKRAYNQQVMFTRTSAQLLTVMASNGLALCTFVVPSGKTHYQLRCLQWIVELQRNANRPVIHVLSVDNASHIGLQLKAFYHSLTGGQTLTVLQDLYHARDRIERELTIGHPLRWVARQEWRALIVDVIASRCTSMEEWRAKMKAFYDKYCESVVYSAVGDMHMVSEAGKLLLSREQPDQLQNALDARQMVDLYSQHNPHDVDNSNQISKPTLRKAGATSLLNLINDDNIAYTYDRTQAMCANSKGTTGNESYHKLNNVRSAKFGGLVTFATRQQQHLVIQYQFNTERLYNTGQYWCDIDMLPYNCVRQAYHAPLGVDQFELLRRLEIDWKPITWSPINTVALKQLVKDLTLGHKYVHTGNLNKWLSQQDGLEGMKPAECGKRFKAMLKELQHQQQQQQSTVVSAVPTPVT